MSVKFKNFAVWVKNGLSEFPYSVTNFYSLNKHVQHQQNYLPLQITFKRNFIFFPL